tara:strand:+ start:477 stop:905 length:429 start_codon:yes stop_codon:yes gene_type:complete
MKAKPMSTGSSNDWGTATFDSDAAIQWVEGFALTPSVGALESALDGVTDSIDDLGAAHAVLAAAEVVAAWCGRPAPDLPVPLTPWLMGRSESLPRDLVAQAHAATLAVSHTSALREQWRARNKLKAWESDVQALVERLGHRG